MAKYVKVQTWTGVSEEEEEKADENDEEEARLVTWLWGVWEFGAESAEYGATGTPLNHSN